MPGHNDWYQIEYNSELEDHNEFILKFNLSNPAQLMSFQAAADYTAHSIYQQHKNIFLALSGGLDSEFIANVLLRNQIPFTPIIFAFKKTREHFYALHWCDLHNIKPLIIDVEEDDSRFVSLAEQLANRYRMPVIANTIACYLTELAKSHDGVLLHGEPTIQNKTVDFYEASGELFNVYHIQFISDLTHPLHSIGFFFYTPEIVLSAAVYSDPTLDDARSRTKLYECVSYRPKYWPPAIPMNDVARRKIDLKNAPFSKDSGYTKLINCEWSKKELLEVLTNLNNSV
jgi:hypothetical protein